MYKHQLEKDRDIVGQAIEQLNKTKSASKQTKKTV
jgi:hypothetical protein